MATQDTIIDYLVSHEWEELDNVFEGDTRVFKTQWKTDDVRSQVVWLQVNEDFFQLLSPFAKEDDFSSERALNANGTLMGVGKYLGHFCLVFVGVVSSFSEPEFELAEALIAKNADDIEYSSGGGDEL